MTKIKVEYTAPVPHMYTPPDIFIATLPSKVGIKVFDNYFELVKWSDTGHHWVPLTHHDRGKLTISDLSLLVDAYNNRGGTNND